jgi:hypothetical protein
MLKGISFGRWGISFSCFVLRKQGIVTSLTLSLGHAPFSQKIKLYWHYRTEQVVNIQLRQILTAKTIESSILRISQVVHTFFCSFE